MTPKRRAPYGSGTKPAQRGDGLWVARIEAGWSPTGTRRRVVVSAKTETECKRRLKEKQRELATGRGTGLNARETVKTWAETWLPRHAKKVRPTTYATDAGTVRKWIVPALGHRRLADLNPGDLRRLEDTIRGAGRSSTTALHAHTILRVMLRAAVVEGHHIAPGVLAAPKPAKSTNDRGALPLDQALAIIEVVTARDDAPRWVASLLNGMRQGEALGLTWDRVDVTNNTLDVRWQLQWLTAGGPRPDRWEEIHLTGRAHLTRPKTGAGHRVIPIVPWMRASLDVARQQWEPNPWGLLWTHDGQPVRDDDDRAAWHAIQAEAGVAHPSGRPWHGHEMRHTTATLLLEAGVDRAVIEAILGQAVLVESYLHVGQDQARKALEAVADRLALGQVEA
jgi:integrase